MTVAWIGVGTALLGAGASYAGSKKQSDASKKGANLQMEQFNRMQAQQQPFIQSGYGAMGKLNTLLGLGGGQAGYGGQPRGGAIPPGMGPQAPPSGLTVNNGPYGPGVRLPQYLPGGSGDMQNHMISGPKMAPQDMGGQSSRLKKLLALRASHGDSEAARMLELV
jgi:hypothetical protein